MSIQIKCSSCGKLLRAPDNSEGKQVRCSGCQTVLQVPGVPKATTPVTEPATPKFPGVGPGARKSPTSTSDFPSAASTPQAPQPPFQPQTPAPTNPAPTHPGPNPPVPNPMVNPGAMDPAAPYSQPQAPQGAQFQATNPYQTPSGFGAPAGKSDGSLKAIQPLKRAAGWMTFLGWLFIIIGFIYCLTIAGIIVGWLPILLGFNLKAAGESLKRPLSDDTVRTASTKLGTAFTLMGVASIIMMIIFVLYAFVVAIMVVFTVSNASAM